MSARRLRFAPIFAVFALLAACQTAPTAEQRAEIDRAGDAAQFARLAHVTEQGGDLNAAANLYRRAIAIRPEKVAYRLALGKILIRLALPRNAAIQYQQALKTEPKNVDALAGLGVALDLQGDHASAQKRYREGMALDPKRLSLKNNLALSLALDGKYDEAIEIQRAIISDIQATPLNRLNLALIYGLAGRSGEAAEISRGLLTHEEIGNNLAYYKRLREMAPEQRRRAVLGQPPPE